MNKILLVGRIGRTPEVRFTKSGIAVASLSLATDEYYGGETHTEWHKIVAWGKDAEFAGAYLSKGALVEVDGRNQTREWTDKDDNKRQTTEVHANSLKSLMKGEEKKAGKDEPEDDSPPF